MYKINDLRFSYPGSDRTVLDGVSLEIASGDVLSILGPNGAGKSTLLSCMVGLLQPDSGSISLSGQNISSLSVQNIAKTVSFVPQTVSPTFAYSVFEFVLMGRAPLISTFGKPGRKDREAASRALDRMGISHLKDRAFTEISGGERQQATIARAIVRDPKVILFDEPTAHLDFGNQLRTLTVIKELSRDGFTTVITTHNPDHAIMLGGRAAILDRNGLLTSGSVDELIREDTLSKVYGADLKVRYVEDVGRKVCLYPNI